MPCMPSMCCARCCGACTAARRAQRERVELDALFIWSTMHGLAGVMNGSCVDKLDLKASVLERAMPHVMERIGHAMGQTKG